MRTFYIPLEKNYIKLLPPDDYDSVTLIGYFPLKAKTQEEAMKKAERLLYQRRGTLQTSDPRIVWDQDPPDEDGWDYEDFTFGLPDDEKANPSDWSRKPF